MARYTGPKNRLARKFGEDLGLKTNALKTAKRLSTPPGQHGAKGGRRKVSQYGTQLKEKQKLKAIYGVLEKQLVALYKEASEATTNTGTTLLSFLERRLDNVIYKAGFAATRAAARQIVNHGHLLVNDKKINIPSYRLQVGDVVVVRGKSASKNFLAEAIKNNEKTDLGWLNVKGGAVTMKRLPEREEITENIEEQLIVEFYSK
jgi:small subunit ribosomal protein S4